VADQHFHESWFGNWSWVIVPVLVLGVDLTIAHSAQKTLEKVWEVPKGEDLLDVKVIGHQWWWEYEYLDHSWRSTASPGWCGREPLPRRRRRASTTCATWTTRWSCRWGRRCASCTPPPT
jgi:heme/copper-type cytochrome/quinol oxidase subunit 2